MNRPWAATNQKAVIQNTNGIENALAKRILTFLNGDFHYITQNIEEQCIASRFHFWALDYWRRAMLKSRLVNKDFFNMDSDWLVAMLPAHQTPGLKIRVK